MAIGGTEDKTRLLEAAEEQIEELRSEIRRLRVELKKYLDWDEDGGSECFDPRHVPLEATLAAHQAVVRELAEFIQDLWWEPDQFPKTVEEKKRLLAHPLVVAARTEGRG